MDNLQKSVIIKPMKLSMYTDMEKNLFMFMPEDISDEEIVKLGEICFPEIEAKAKNGNTLRWPMCWWSLRGVFLCE